MKVALLPEGVLPKVVAVVAGEDDGGLFAQAETIELIKDTSNLFVHEGHRGVISGPHSLLIIRKFPDSVESRAATGDSELGHVVEVVGDGLGKSYLLPWVGIEILLWLNHRVVGPHKSRREKEALVLMLSEKLYGFTGSLVVRLIRSVAFVTH